MTKQAQIVEYLLEKTAVSAQAINRALASRVQTLRRLHPSKVKASTSKTLEQMHNIKYTKAHEYNFKRHNDRYQVISGSELGQMLRNKYKF